MAGFWRIFATMRVERGFAFLLAVRTDVHLPTTATATVNGEPGRQIQRAESAVMDEIHDNGPRFMIAHGRRGMHAPMHAQDARK